MNSYKIMFTDTDGIEAEAYYFANSKTEACNLFGADFGDLAFDIEEEAIDPDEYDRFNNSIEMGDAE